MFSNCFSYRPVALITFDKTHEADTALYLDNGLVCGGPIQVFRYKDSIAHISEAHREAFDKVSRKLSEISKSENSKSEVSSVAKDNIDSEVPVAESLYPSLPDTDAVSVLVKNISVNANAAVIADFFSYCGTVKNVIMYK